VRNGEDGNQEGLEEEGLEEEGDVQVLNPDDHGSFVMVALLARDKAEEGLRWAKSNWQVLAVAAAIVTTGTRTLAGIEINSGTLDSNSMRITALEKMQLTVADRLGGVETTAAMILVELREMRKDARAGRVIR